MDMHENSGNIMNSDKHVLCDVIYSKSSSLKTNITNLWPTKLRYNVYNTFTLVRLEK